MRTLILCVAVLSLGACKKAPEAAAEPALTAAATAVTVTTATTAAAPLVAAEVPPSERADERARRESIVANLMRRFPNHAETVIRAALDAKANVIMQSNALRLSRFINAGDVLP